MRILVSGSTRLVRELAPQFPGHLGHLTTPYNGNRSATLAGTGMPWAADNGCFQGLDAPAYRRLLSRLRGLPNCLWVVVPDAVADAGATLSLWREWTAEVRAAGQGLAFVGQDGAEDCELPWGELDAYFVGGSTAWKLSRASADLVGEAKRRGKWVHMGRVNSLRRLRTAWEWGCDSVDGSSYSKFHHRTVTHRPDMALERHLRFLVSLDRQPSLWS